MACRSLIWTIVQPLLHYWMHWLKTRCTLMEVVVLDKGLDISTQQLGSVQVWEQNGDMRTELIIHLYTCRNKMWTYMYMYSKNENDLLRSQFHRSI